MDTRKKIGIILCIIIALAGAFYLSSFIFLLLHDFPILQAIDRWTPSLILDGLTDHWSETYQAIGLSIAVMGLLTLNRQTQKTHDNIRTVHLSSSPFWSDDLYLFDVKSQKFILQDDLSEKGEITIVPSHCVDIESRTLDERTYNADRYLWCAILIITRQLNNINYGALI